jgi:hypothetical protein
VAVACVVVGDAAPLAAGGSVLHVPTAMRVMAVTYNLPAAVQPVPIVMWPEPLFRLRYGLTHTRSDSSPSSCPPESGTGSTVCRASGGTSSGDKQELRDD